MSDPANRTESGRVFDGRFTKGVSGNPNGRPKGNVQALARSHTEAAIQTLASCLTDPKLKVQAAVALLDRGWGRPAQEILSSNDGISLTFLHLIAARASSEAINARYLEGAAAAPVADDTAPPTSRPPINLFEPALE